MINPTAATTTTTTTTAAAGAGVVPTTSTKFKSHLKNNNNNNKYKSKNFNNKYESSFDLDSSSDLDDFNIETLKHHLKPLKQLKPLRAVNLTPLETHTTSDQQLDRVKTPTIFYVKQKYKMYLDWLSENYNQQSSNTKQHMPANRHVKQNSKNINNYFLNNISPTNTNTTTATTAATGIGTIASSIDLNNLNWYKYESSILSQQQQQQQLNPSEKPTKHDNHQQQQHTPTLLTPRNDYFSNLTSKSPSNKLYQTQSQLPQILTPINKLRPLNTNKKPPQMKPAKTLKKSTGDNFHENSSTSLNNDENEYQNSSQYIASQILNNKAVKFESNLLNPKTTTNNYIHSNSRKLSRNHSLSLKPNNLHQPLKPILKTTFNEHSSYLNSSSFLQRSSVPNINTNSPPSTAASIPVSDTGQQKDEHFYNRVNGGAHTTTPTSTSTTVIQNRVHAKLPPLSDIIKQKPIANCSDDFYAVINEMENDRLV